MREHAGRAGGTTAGEGSGGREQGNVEGRAISGRWCGLRGALQELRARADESGEERWAGQGPRGQRIPEWPREGAT